MLRISHDTIRSFNASIDDEGEEVYLEKFWGQLEIENPEFLSSLLSNMEDMEREGVDHECINSWLNGVFMTYSLIDRQIESETLEKLCA